MTTSLLTTQPAPRLTRAVSACVRGGVVTVVLAGLLGACVFDDVPERQKDLTATPAQLEGAEIVPKLGAKVPLDTKLLDEDGKPVSLDAVLAKDKPTLLLLGYWECPMLCSFVLNATKDALADVDGLEPGVDFNVVAVGIDPTEGASLAKAKQQNYLKELAKVRGVAEVPASSWRFLSAPQDEGFISDKHESKAVRTLADAVGFGYRYDVQTENYAHGAGIFFISPDGTLTRTLWGISFRSKDVRLAIVEAGQGLVGTVIDRVVLSCFQFGPEGQYSVYVWGVMRIGAIVMVLGMATFLITLFRRERRRERELERELQDAQH